MPQNPDMFTVSFNLRWDYFSWYHAVTGTAICCWLHSKEGKPRKEVRLYLEIIQTYCTKIIKGSLHGDAIPCELYNLNFQSGPNNFGKEAKSMYSLLSRAFIIWSVFWGGKYIQWPPPRTFWDSMFVLYAEAYLSMEFYSPHNRFEGRPSCRGNVSIFWAQRFERKCRTKIAAPQN
jgi:hypothetical protein